MNLTVGARGDKRIVDVGIVGEGICAVVGHWVRQQETRKTDMACINKMSRACAGRICVFMV